MKDQDVQYQVCGPSAQAASAKFVPAAAAKEIRHEAFGYGAIFGFVVGGILMLLGLYQLSTTQVSEGNPDTPSGPRRPVEQASRKKNSEPFFGIPVLGPQVPGKYAYAIGQDSFLPVKHEDGASFPSGTVKDGHFMLTKRRPSDALSLPQDIDDSWRSPFLFSAKLKKPTALQRRDASWWSESRGEYIPWESRDVQPDRYVFDADHGIAVPLLMCEFAIDSQAAPWTPGPASASRVRMRPPSHDTTATAGTTTSFSAAWIAWSAANSPPTWCANRSIVLGDGACQSTCRSVNSARSNERGSPTT
jgi:hypothetical protein